MRLSNLTEDQTRQLVTMFFYNHGKIPVGTTFENWGDVTMSEMQFDDPPLPGDPDYEKKKLAVLLQHEFNMFGLNLKSPLKLMKKGSAKVKDLWTFCFENQSVMEVA